jgi:hypothetical protein
VKLRAQNSHGKFVPVVEKTVNEPLKTVCGNDSDVETLLPTVTVLVTT